MSPDSASVTCKQIASDSLWAELKTVGKDATAGNEARIGLRKMHFRSSRIATRLPSTGDADGDASALINGASTNQNSDRSKDGSLGSSACRRLANLTCEGAGDLGGTAPKGPSLSSFCRIMQAIAAKRRSSSRAFWVSVGGEGRRLDALRGSGGIGHQNRQVAVPLRWASLVAGVIDTGVRRN